MANALYPKWKEALMQATSGTSLTGTLKAALIDTGTASYNSAHDFWDDISAGVVGTPVTLTTKTYTNGTLDADNVAFTAVTGATVEAIVLFLDTGTPSTSRLVCWLDTGVTGLPVTPNGGDINITWDAAGIFTL